MRFESSVTAITWIPSEAVKGSFKVPFELGVAHYDQAPPDAIALPDQLEELRVADRFRLANHFRAWIEVVGGEIVDYGWDGVGRIGSTTIKVGRAVTVAAVPLPDIQPEPEVGEGWVRFTQTAGGRTGFPVPRWVSRPPFVQVKAPLGWTTVSLTLHADGRVEHHLAGASPFPRHWLYDGHGKLLQKSGMIDFDDWYRHAFGTHSPWGDEDSPALATEVETALERQLSDHIMQGGKKPRIVKVKKGRTLVEQGEAGAEVFLLLDGVLAVEVNGERLAELGPGAVVGERAVLEDGARTATLRAITPCKVAVARRVELEPKALERLREGHRREQRR